MFSGWFRRRRGASDFEAEIESHIELEAERLEAGGLDREQARAAAQRKFGNATRAQERFFEATHWVSLESLGRDLRTSYRALRKSPSFSFAAVATLAVAIGANAVVFAALNAGVLRPLNVPAARSLYSLQPRLGDTSLQMSYPDYLDFRARNRSFDDLASFNIQEVGLDSGARPALAWICEVTGNYFDVLRIHPYLGRFFHASDEHGADSAPVAVLAYAYWRTHFGGDRGVVGHIVRIDRHPFTILGVAPPKFRGTILFFSPGLFIPIVDEAEIEDANFLHLRSKPMLFFGAMGHLKAGVTPAAAVAELNAIGAQLNRTYPKQESPYSFSLKRPSLYGDFLGRPVRAFLTALMLLAGLILLAACANLGGLFAARARDRGHEVALRLALGAGRMRVIRQLFTEAILVSLVGGGLGLWGSILLLRWLAAWQPFPQFPINLPVSPDARVYLVALFLALASGVLFGAAPVWQVLQTDPYQVVKDGSLAATARRRFSARQLLLAAQIAICAVLVTASAVAVRGLERSLHANFGFQPQHVTLVTADLRMAGYGAAEQPAMQKRMLAAMGAIPGVSAVALTDWIPLGMEGYKDEPVFRGSATDLRPAKEAADAIVLKISPGYFHAARTALLSGRDFAWSDDSTAPRVAVVNRLFARTLFDSPAKARGGAAATSDAAPDGPRPSGQARWGPRGRGCVPASAAGSGVPVCSGPLQAGAIGGRFRLQDGTYVRIVGIVADSEYNSLTDPLQPAMFLPLAQWPSESVLLVRSGRDPGDLALAIRGRLHRLDPGLPAFLEPWTQAMDGALFPPRVATVALGILGLLGAILSIVGIFGLAAYAVSQRKRELGIRMALGARAGEVLRAALAPALRLLVVGSAIGLLLGVLASSVLAAIVYEATPRDPVALAGVVAAMALIGLLATWIPAQRALAISPAALLREE